LGTDSGFDLRITSASATADFDEDGDIDGVDLTKWKTGFGTNGTATHVQGDADQDLDVDGADFLTWQRQLGPAAVAAASVGVPEPATAIFLVLGLAMPGAFTRQRALKLQCRERQKPT
jgi:hypothetical protein